MLAKLSVDQVLMKARSHAKKGEIAVAQRLYQSVLQVFAKNQRAQQGLAALNNYKLNNTIQSLPQGTIDRLVSLYNQGHFSAVFEKAEALTKQYPDVFIIWNLLGASAAQAGLLDKAIKAFKKVILLKPNFADAYSNMGNVLKNQGKGDEAIDAYKKALSLNPDYVDAYSNMGNALQAQGKLDESIDAYKKAISLKPDYADGYYNIGVVLQGQSKLDQAIDAYSRAILLKSDHADAYYNMGNVLKDQSKLDEAIDAYNKAISLNPNYANAFSNMGVALQEQGKYEEAIDIYQKSISLKPDFAVAYNNMGNALKDQGKLNEAIDAYNKAISLNPNYGDAYTNLGVAHQDQGKLDEAIDAHKKSISLKPDYAVAYNNMGVVLQDQGMLDEAIETYNEAISLNPDYAEAYYNMGVALEGLILKKTNPSLQSIIMSLLDQKSYVRPRNISKAAISLLKLEPKLNKHLQSISVDQLKLPLQEVIANLSELTLLLKLMSVCPIDDIELESLLKELRAKLLLSNSSLMNIPDVLRFQSALALQCFNNEYIYSQSEDEDKALEDLEGTVKLALKNNKQQNTHSILCLASYRPLNDYEWCDKIVINTEIQDVFTSQVLEPKQETNFKSKLTLLKEINNEISSKVRDQYESNPYPRWIKLGLPLRPSRISKVINNFNLKLFDYRVKKVEAPNILIAGCGTGQETIETAARFKDSKVIAIDLRLSSLAYAKRKTQELGIQNIKYMQADILDLDKLDKKFDILVSAGVLHHMNDPIAGWQVLTDCLKPGGLMRIGLYSKLARQNIVKMREEILEEGIGSNEADMKLFRSKVMKSEKKHHKQIQNSSDFYSLSEFRDLLFHVQEHMFTIPKIQESLSHLGLKFCGFESEKIVSKFKLTNTNIDDCYKLDKWQVYEEANPSVFFGMYQFWCQKIS